MSGRRARPLFVKARSILSNARARNADALNLNGFTLGTLSAMMARDRYFDRKNPWFDLFRVDRRRMMRETRDVLSELSVNVPSVRTPVRFLSGGQRQGVAIARAVHQGGQLMIMDEPTAALGVQEQAKVLQLIRDLKARGIAVIVTSHNLEHVFSVADRIVVLRGGRLVGSRIKDETTHSEIVHMIVGAEFGRAQ